MKITLKQLKKIYPIREREPWELPWKKNYIEKLYNLLKKDWEGYNLYKENNINSIMNDLVQVFYLTEDFIAKYRYALNWNFVCSFQKLSEDFIILMKDYINWSTLCDNQELSEEFIREYTPKIFDEKLWYHLCLNKYIKFSESFMREMSDYICWNNIGDHQKFTKEFIRENANKLRYSFIHVNKELDVSEKDMEEFTSKDKEAPIWFVSDLMKK